MGATPGGDAGDERGGTAEQGPHGNPAASEWVETVVHEGETVAATCPYCDRPFGSEDAHDLHVGDVHAAACSDAEREAYEDAREDERDDLFYFHLRVVAALGVLYAFTVLLYMVALGSNIL